jgi:hypothetical protein
MLEAPCPQCGAPLTFRSVGLPIIVCDYCRSTVMRNGDALSKTGSSAGVPEAASPLQLGVTGVADGEAFQLIGRVRWLWGATADNGQIAQGCWTEWLMLFADSSFGWLAEAGGRLMVSRRHQISANNMIFRALSDGEAVRPGQGCQIDGRRFTVIDVRHAVSAGCDGEIPFAAPPGETLFSVDLGGSKGGFASLQRHDGQVECYLGRTVRLAELRPQGLRAVPGWEAPAWAGGSAP